jgi:hypothetical protein
MHVVSSSFISSPYRKIKNKRELYGSIFLLYGEKSYIVLFLLCYLGYQPEVAILFFSLLERSLKFT